MYALCIDACVEGEVRGVRTVGYGMRCMGWYCGGLAGGDEKVR